MKLCRKYFETRSRLNIASMIDVVFLLIIFFMTVSHVSNTEAEKLNLPESEKFAEKQPVRKTLTINIRPDGRIVGFSNAVDMARLERIIEADISRFGKDNLKINLRADRALSWSKVRPVLSLFAAKGVTDVKVSVQEK